ncbi:PREDICTED: cytochrome b561 and DOMON domain-containing protein At3g07570-like [Nelumbo nucifera]|uniref:Cytochrome b561 and DOMON domain-containing protein At3g07570-like n=1 Tax=Nelumbo nucifera TaxID=4432 RepID=A0A1U8APY2_NELNU|nr:PREDICTED: cytochrome b561 and DOMON domain-containing protein At3g07570-like [Nelumbo nucifera]
MKVSLVTTVFFCLFLGFAFSTISCQSDSCGSTLTLSGIPFDTTTLNCQLVWSSQDFILRYEQRGPSLWNFILSTPDSNSYVAIGFSPDGSMVGSSSIVGWFPAGDRAAGVIKQYYLGGTGSQDCSPDSGDLKVANMTIISQSSRLYLAFQLNTDRPKSNLIYAVGPRSRLPSSPSYLMSEHQSKTSTSLNFKAGTTTTPGTSLSPSQSPTSGTEDTKDTSLVPTSGPKGSQDKSSNPSITQGTNSSSRNHGSILNVLGGTIMMIIGYFFIF